MIPLCIGINLSVSVEMNWKKYFLLDFVHFCKPLLFAESLSTLPHVQPANMVHER